ncbi:MAG: AbrB/MazE/SpoVT family DNA-binding domain-containing protein [Syntrophomonadaceae bacterium]|nr:AbrB/MazE/SpoVT family DNA-binding domain-containing protein [Syntrophomonadaceae bacterium]
MKSTVTISSKRQITIPANMFRLLNLQQGQKLIVEVDEGRLIISPRPDSLTKELRGLTKGLFGKTASEIDDYLKKERDEWHNINQDN